MHELGITQEIVSLVSERAGGARVLRIVLEIGKLSAILPDAIRFCFDLCAEGTPAEGAELVIREPAGLARCLACGGEVVLERPGDACGGIELEWLSGEQLRIIEMETSYMCAVCGCGDPDGAVLIDMRNGAKMALPDDHGHSHGGHDHSHGGHGHSHGGHDHQHDHGHSHTVRLEQEVLAKNNRLAERNRGWFAGRNILALNLVSSPGSGKTTLVERTIRDVGGELPFLVVEGDQATTLDAERIQATGCRVVQINTGAGCHLDASMLARGLVTLDPPAGSVVLIENVGNLVCPALFDLGERAKVVVVSVTEGDDKPLKYPHMFRAASLMLLNKTDLLPYVQFDVERCLRNARQVNPALRAIQVSATRGDGLQEWYAWLREQKQRPEPF